MDALSGESIVTGAGGGSLMRSGESTRGEVIGAGICVPTADVRVALVSTVERLMSRNGSDGRPRGGGMGHDWVIPFEEDRARCACT